MSRVFIEHHGDAVALPEGATVVGRELGCGLRFNDAALSRRQCRFLVDGARVAIEDLGSRNGTRVNGELVRGRRTLRHGDVVQVGQRTLRVLIAEPSGAAAAPGRETQPALPPVDPAAAASPPRRCAGCGDAVPRDAIACPGCGRPLPEGHPGSPTLQIRAPDMERRGAPRVGTHLPVLYASDTLALDSEARNIAPGGVFIASELLDPPGTPCRVTLLPDGGPAIVSAAVVRHARHTHLPGGAPPGMGIALTGLDEAGRRRLAALLATARGPSPDP